MMYFVQCTDQEKTPEEIKNKHFSTRDGAQTFIDKLVKDMQYPELKFKIWHAGDTVSPSRGI